MTPGTGSPLAGQSAVVTGASSGIGFHTALLFARRGASVTITGRDPKRGAGAVAAIRAAAGHGAVRFMACDHSLAAANQDLAARLTSSLDRLDLLVNNVGGISAKRRVTEEGIEWSLAVNFLAPFTLTGALLPKLRESPGVSRCPNVVSSAYKMARGDPFEDLQAARSYVGIEVHGRAKLFTLLWSLGLSRHTPPRELVVVAVNPGMTWTPMTQSMTPEVVPAWRYFFPVVRAFQRRAHPARAAGNCERLALATLQAVSGRYFDGKKPKRLPDQLGDPELIERVMRIGMQLRSSALA